MGAIDSGVNNNVFRQKFADRGGDVSDKTELKPCPCTQKDVAERAGVSPAFVCNVLKGKRTSTRVAKIIKEMLGEDVKCTPTMRDTIQQQAERIKYLETIIERALYFLSQDMVGSAKNALENKEKTDER